MLLPEHHAVPGFLFVVLFIWPSPLFLFSFPLFFNTVTDFDEPFAVSRYNRLYLDMLFFNISYHHGKPPERFLFVYQLQPPSHPGHS
jgi:hypothetical protein